MFIFDLIQKYKYILYGIGIILFLILSYFLFYKEDSSIVKDISDPIQISEIEKQGSEELEAIELVVVHIAGMVNNPGVVTLESGKRVIDAINSCDGLANDADISNINLAAILEDGEKVYIPSIHETNFETSNDSNSTSSNQTNSSQNNYSNNNNNSNNSNSSNTTNSKVNINTANQSALETLPGIGEATAKKIIDYRNSNGKFKSLEDIMNVSGIGEAKFNNIKDLICL